MTEKNEKRERMIYNFCCHYAVLGNPEEAAVKAGYPKSTALADAADCLNDENCRNLITALSRVISDESPAKVGLRRLAFGSSRDAVTLAFSEEAPTQDSISDLDLFNVSEIKRVKGGGVEIKFFDRLKALEKLYELETEQYSRENAEGLLEALAASAGKEKNENT